MRLVVYERDDCGGSFAADSREGLEVVAGCSGNLTKGTEVAHDCAGGDDRNMRSARERCFSRRRIC